MEPQPGIVSNPLAANTRGRLFETKPRLLIGRFKSHKNMKKLLYILLLLPVFTYGQEANGVRFEQGNLEQIKAEAKQENKYIFVDCYATWCGPCKQMDQTVYPDTAVGNFINTAFLSIKLQMDSTAKDDQITKDRYADAYTIKQQYRVSALPTFLFFSPNGDLVQQGDGLMAPADFIGLAKQALEPEKLHYYQLLTDYKNGKKNYSTMPYLALTARQYHQDEMASQIAVDYKGNYLNHADEKVLIESDNLAFIRVFLNLVTGSGDPYFKLFYNHPEVADSSWHYPGGSKMVVNWIIKKEGIDDKYIKNGKAIIPNPDWINIYMAIKTKYGKDYADNDINLAAKISFYRKAGEWKLWADSINIGIKQYPPKELSTNFGEKTDLATVAHDDWTLNSIAWDAFQHCDNKKALRSALKWSDLSIKINTDIIHGDPGMIEQFLDTKANLLYKLGKVKEAIKTEQSDCDLVTDPAGKKEFLATIEKMHSGKKTW
jgi:thioredoxin-related protein